MEKLKHHHTAKVTIAVLVQPLCFGLQSAARLFTSAVIKKKVATRRSAMGHTKLKTEIKRDFRKRQVSLVYRHFSLVFASLVVASLVMTGCSGRTELEVEEIATVCPNIVLDPITSSFSLSPDREEVCCIPNNFRDNGINGITEVVITGYRSACKRMPTDHLTMTLSVRFSATRSDELTARKIIWPYFVAITQTVPKANVNRPLSTEKQTYAKLGDNTILDIDSSTTILAKKIFLKSGQFLPSSSRISLFDSDVTVILPLLHREPASRYQVFIGFQLTPKQFHEKKTKLLN